VERHRLERALVVLDASASWKWLIGLGGARQHLFGLATFAAGWETPSAARGRDRPDRLERGGFWTMGLSASWPDVLP
jgi:hypothetical protein